MTHLGLAPAALPQQPAHGALAGQVAPLLDHRDLAGALRGQRQQPARARQGKGKRLLHQHVRARRQRLFHQFLVGARPGRHHHRVAGAGGQRRAERAVGQFRRQPLLGAQSAQAFGIEVDDAGHVVAFRQRPQAAHVGAPAAGAHDEGAKPPH